MKKRAIMAAAVISAFIVTGPTARADERTVVDCVGRAVTVPADPGRIVSLAPNITEILYTIGAGDRVVGVTDYCRYPDSDAEPARIGGFVNPSLEVIISLDPDLVIGTADGNRPIDIHQMAKTGLCVYVIDTRSIGDIYRSIEAVGSLTGLDEAAGKVVTGMQQTHLALQRRVAGKQKPTVLYLLGMNPMVGVGPGTFLDHLIGEAGGRNVLAGSLVKYPLISMENLLAVDPEIIIMNAVSGMDEGVMPGYLEKIAGWDRLRAHATGRVHLLENESILQPGPRIMEALERLITIFHPPDRGEGVDHLAIDGDEQVPLEDEEVESSSGSGVGEPSLRMDMGVEP